MECTSGGNGAIKPQRSPQRSPQTGAPQTAAPQTPPQTGASRDGIVPEPLEVLLQDICPYSFQVAAQQIDKFVDLLVGEVGGTLQQAPAAMGQHRFFPLFFKAFSFLGTDFINGLAHVGGNMKTVKDVNRPSRSCGNNFQIRPPHVATDKTQSLAAVFSQPVKKTVHGSDGSLFAQPQQTLASLVDLVDHGDKNFTPFFFFQEISSMPIALMPFRFLLARPHFTAIRTARTTVSQLV